MNILEDMDDEDIEWGDVSFSPAAILIFEQSLVNEVWERINHRQWSKNYIDGNGNRRFTITLALGLQLEFRVSIGTTMNIIIRGTNVLPGGQTFLTDSRLMDTLIGILRTYNRSLLSSSLIPVRELHKWRRDHNKWKKDTFNYDIPENLIFQIPKDECEVVKMETTVRMIVQDRITKGIVEVIGNNEDTNLTFQRASSKLYTMRELRPLDE